MEDDLLYTNKFVNTSSLTPQQLNQDANQFIPYRTLKGGQVNNVQSTLERTFRQDNPLTQRQLRAYGWNKGEFGNERPVLSDFARDIGESSYFRYKTSYLNVDSRMRDVSLYPRPNNYEIFLGRKFQNVESIKLVDYFFPEMSYPINYMNHVVMWMTIPFEMIVTTRGGLIDVVPSVTYKTGDLNICSFITDFRQLANDSFDCETAKKAVSNNIMKNLFTIDIPSGNYTTEELAEQIEYLWNQKLFFDSDTFSTGDYFLVDPNSETYNFYRKPQNVKVTIDAHTSMVNFLLRYESVKVEKLQSYINKNYFDITLKVPDPLVSSQQYLDLVANEIFPIVLTDFPSLGGFRQENINYKEFLPYKQVELNNNATLPPTDWLYKTYYGKVTDPDTGNPVPNVLRFYMYDANGHESIFSSDEIILYDDVCKLLCGARLGREAPFFLISGDTSPLSQFVEETNNNIYNVSPTLCQDCNVPEFEEKKPECEIFSKSFIEQFTGKLCNVDNSSRLLVNLLGYFNTLNNQSVLGPLLFARGIQPNLLYKQNTFINTVQTLSLEELSAANFLDCQYSKGKTNAVDFNYVSENQLDFKLPVCKNPNGTYSFYTNNYFFMKLLNSGINNNANGTIIEQVKPTPNFGNGTNDVYYYDGNTVKGYDIVVEDTSLDTVQNCVVPKGGSTGTFQKLIKDVNNIFAKIKMSGNAGSCVVEDPFLNEMMYFDGCLTSLDSFVVQLIDYEGKILELSKEHNFVLMIVEKIEVLKETNINSRTGFVNTVGTTVVERNSYGK